MLDELKGKDIILASRSPRRKHLLSALGITYRIAGHDISEDYPSGLRNEEIALFLAARKADAVIMKTGGENPDRIVIAADTIVCLGDMILNKPSDRSEAVDMLKNLSGRAHDVITAVCIAGDKRKKSFYSETRVYFAKLQDAEIEYYIDNFKPYDKAGAYGIQEWIGYTGIERIEGSYFNVMGLPVQRLYRELINFVKDDII
ncbi:MAG: septum formation protein Maf [Bacteroidales bacterium]|nr:septum formation protein Maf [Bacteroidales bacterium]